MRNERRELVPDSEKPLFAFVNKLAQYIFIL